ncbi:T9SS type A sorting domain-containing protein [Paenimyroides viscosum]|uniref:T9SS C-terminal target domain-containing protein n=1 Tax=Paenimyroides viscosum TaxID=2488729 RepID=A0A3P1B228_9FLAO|nr:T9SS type A sorting domain-containing protein [Paenimyroides viscosum]RRA95005.1 T9SS C-terminal target domain-containing protein [Paenimyroides viscosum]
MKKLIIILLTLVPFLTKAQVTLIPDSTFEQLLINLNIDSDGILNGQMLTSDAQNITQLNLYTGAGSFRILNMTGIEAFTNLELLLGSFHEFNNINLSTLTKLDTLILPSNSLKTINLSNNVSLEYLHIGNYELEFAQYNLIRQLDLSSNVELRHLDLYNLFTLERINLKNNKSSQLKIILGNENETFYPYNVCIEVDDPVAATNGTAPYDTWTVLGNHYYDQNCALSIEKFVNDNFKIYPNPATEYVSIEQKETKDVTLQSVQILDSSGKWIKSVKDNFNQIDVSNLSKGMYLFVIQTDKGNKTEKIIVK